jgi:PEP-CTERM motif
MKMKNRSGAQFQLAAASKILGIVVVFCAAPLVAAAPLDPRYGAIVELLNLAPHSFSGQTSAGGSVTTDGAVLTEGGASFSGSPAINVNVTSVPGREVQARAYIFDTLTFEIEGGGSALVPVRMAGRWSGLGGRVNAALALGQGPAAPALIYSGNGFASEFPSDPSFTRTGDMATGYDGSYIIGALWSINDVFEFSIGAFVSAQTGGGGHIYIDDPLTIDLPSGVTFTSASGSTYSSAVVVPVPEPATWLLFAGAFIAFARQRGRVNR